MAKNNLHERKGSTMKAIVVKVLPVTNKKPLRVKAKAEGLPGVVLTWDHNKDEQNYLDAALALCFKYNWRVNETPGFKLYGGVLPNQDRVFVMVGNYPTIE